MTLVDGFWFGLGFILSFCAIVLFAAVVSLITAFIVYLMDRKKGKKGKDGGKGTR